MPNVARTGQKPHNGPGGLVGRNLPPHELNEFNCIEPDPVERAGGEDSDIKARKLSATEPPHR